MRPIIFSLITFSLLITGGCSAGPSHIEGISKGMSRAEVITILGQPRQYTQGSDSEYLTFKVWRSFWRRQPGNYRDIHYVKFINGMVVEYGDIRALPTELRTTLSM